MRLVLVNNQPANAAIFDDILAAAIGKYRSALSEWQIEIVHREKTLPPIENWYTAVNDYAIEGEVVLLHGDDDVFLPWSLVDRYDVLQSTGADILLTRSQSNLYYVTDASSQKIFCASVPKRCASGKALPLTFEALNTWDSSFIGCAAFRYGDGYRASLNQVYLWTDSQDWVDVTNRRLMTPLYLPFGALHVGAKVVGIEQVCVLRGLDIQEYSRSLISSSGWNSGYLMLLAYGIFCHPELRSNNQLDIVRLRFLENFSTWIFVCLCDSKLTNRQLFETMRQYDITLPVMLRSNLLKSLKLFVQSLFSFRAQKIKRRANREAVSVEEFIQNLRSL